MTVRDEGPGDEVAIRGVNRAAFGSDLEGTLVEALRQHATPLISLVAEDAGAIVGHILFSPVALNDRPDLRLMGLAPMAVVPERQRQGIGSRLVNNGLTRCRQLDAAAVVVLGHPGYYPRFGFVPASRFSIRSEYEVPDEVFMACELRAGALGGLTGVIHYHPAFAAGGL